MFLFNKISVKLSLKLFQIRKPLQLVIFDKLFSKFILNLNNLNDSIAKFHENGFVKINLNIKNEIKSIVKNLKINDEEKNPLLYFHITDEVKNKMNIIINEKLKKTINSLEVYFNSKIMTARINIRRNSYYKKKDSSHELYSDNFHNDAYALTHFKMFVNLMDIQEENGPMHLISKKNTKNFFKKINYKDRNSYDENTNVDDFIYKNVGKEGEILLFDPTQCYHRATIPNLGYHRDYCIITFICLPKKIDLKKNSLDYVNIYNYDKNPLIKFAKPHSLFNTLKTFVKYL
jgi:hypothetical protein